MYGRKIFLKGIIIRKSAFVFYTLSLEKFSDRQFQIKSEEEGGSEFRDLVFTLTFYDTKSYNPTFTTKYPLHSLTPI